MEARRSGPALGGSVRGAGRVVLATAVTLTVALLALAACTRGSPAPTPAPAATSTVVTTQTTTSSPTYRPPAPASVDPLSPGAKPRAGEVEKSCPYLRTGLQLDPTDQPNMADLEGDRIYRVIRLTGYSPVGCRFYFWAGPFEAIADIRPYTFATATQARNAMVLTARTGTEELTDTGFVKGLDGISYRTRYFGPDGAEDWAFAFAKGRHMVVVLTQRNDTSRNAVYIGQAIAARF